MSPSCFGMEGVSREALEGYAALAKAGAGVDDLLAYVAAKGLPQNRADVIATIASVADANRALRPLRDLLGK